MITRCLSSNAHIMYYKSDCIFYACELIYREMFACSVQFQWNSWKQKETGNPLNCMCLKQVRSTFVTVALYCVEWAWKSFLAFSSGIYTCTYTWKIQKLECLIVVTYLLKKNLLYNAWCQFKILCFWTINTAYVVFTDCEENWNINNKENNSERITNGMI